VGEGSIAIRCVHQLLAVWSALSAKDLLVLRRSAVGATSSSSPDAMAITLTTVYVGFSSTAEPVLDVRDAVAAETRGIEYRDSPREG
jgi:hypothetical protein